MDVKAQLPSHHKARGGGRGVTCTVLGPGLSELIGIFQVGKIYANTNLVITGVVLNTSFSLQIGAFSYVNTHFCSIMSVTAFLRLHMGSLFNLQSLVIMLSTNQKLFLNRNKTQQCSEKSLPRYLAPPFGSDTHCCHTYTPCSLSLMFMEARWCGH